MVSHAARLSRAGRSPEASTAVETSGDAEKTRKGHSFGFSDGVRKHWVS